MIPKNCEKRRINFYFDRISNESYTDEDSYKSATYILDSNYRVTKKKLKEEIAWFKKRSHNVIKITISDCLKFAFNLGEGKTAMKQQNLQTVYKKGKFLLATNQS